MRPESGNRRNIDNSSCALPLHDRCHGLDQKKWTCQINSHYFIMIFNTPSACGGVRGDDMMQLNEIRKNFT